MRRALLALRRRPAIGFLIAIALVAVAVVVRQSLPVPSPFGTLFAAVLLGAFLGGWQAGLVGLAAATLAGWIFFVGPDEPAWDLTAAKGGLELGFLVFAGLIVFTIGLLDRALEDANAALEKLEGERQRLALALGAADAGAWEWTPEGPPIWDRTFYDLLGLDPAKEEASTESYIELIHPEDRAEAVSAWGRVVAAEEAPPRETSYRLVRPDGVQLWVQNSRVVRRGKGGVRVIGITQNVSRQKESEEQLGTLLREVSHRVKNQFAVILAMIGEIRTHARSADEFHSEVTDRIYALARSHDVLVEGEWARATLHDVLAAQLKPFADAGRWSAEGPPVMLDAAGVQQLGIAFFELATNAAKYGALSVPGGRIAIAWAVEGTRPELRLSWRESGGPPVVEAPVSGFGRRVLETITPRAVGGSATLDFAPEGLVWNLRARNGFSAPAGR